MRLENRLRRSPKEVPQKLSLLKTWTKGVENEMVKAVDGVSDR